METRVTDWFAFGHHGVSHYRIWQRHSDLGWQQRHEWKLDDGSTQLDEWIRGVEGFLPHANAA